MVSKGTAQKLRQDSTPPGPGRERAAWLQFHALACLHAANTAAEQLATSLMCKLHTLLALGGNGKIHVPRRIIKQPGLLVLCSKARFEGNFPAANNLSGNLTSRAHGHGCSLERRKLHSCRWTGLLTPVPFSALVRLNESVSMGCRRF